MTDVSSDVLTILLQIQRDVGGISASVEALSARLDTLEDHVHTARFKIGLVFWAGGALGSACTAIVAAAIAVQADPNAPPVQNTKLILKRAVWT